MIIPNNTVSYSMLATYGAVDPLDDDSDPKGCPRQYEARYVRRTAPKADNPRLRLGRVVHRAFQVAEDQGIGVQDALQQVWDPALPEDHYAEAFNDLTAYMGRESTPFSDYSTLASEVRLQAQLYVDPEHGPINLVGVIDRIAVDINTPGVVHLGDFKNSARPISQQQVETSTQLMGYAWLVGECWQQLGLPARPKVVVHLDAVKWTELRGVSFTDVRLEAWHAWMVTVVRGILRDTEAKPVLNWGCSYCPIRDTCDAYLAIPDLASSLLETKPESRDQLAAWMMRANAARLLLDKAVDEVNGKFVADTLRLGHLEAGGLQWDVVTRYAQRLDASKLHDLLGDDAFYALVGVTKSGLNAVAKTLAPATASQVLECITDVPAGTTVKRTKVKD